MNQKKRQPLDTKCMSNWYLLQLFPYLGFDIYSSFCVQFLCVYALSQSRWTIGHEIVVYYFYLFFSLRKSLTHWIHWIHCHTKTYSMGVHFEKRNKCRKLFRKTGLSCLHHHFIRINALVRWNRDSIEFCRMFSSLWFLHASRRYWNNNYRHKVFSIAIDFIFIECFSWN